MPVIKPEPDHRPLEQRLAAYGCTNVIRLDGKLSEPAQLDYLDLLPTRASRAPPLTAVAEHQGSALLYLVDACGDVKSDADSLVTVSHQLANRSDPAWLGVVRPGSLEVFPIGFHVTADTRPIIIEERSTTAPLFFQSLVHGTFENNHPLRGTDYVFHKIFDLLTRTTNEFVPKEGKGRLDALEILSLAGRALFFRFLIDRDIVPDNVLLRQTCVTGIAPGGSLCVTLWRRRQQRNSIPRLRRPWRECSPLWPPGASGANIESRSRKYCGA